MGILDFVTIPNPGTQAVLGNDLSKFQKLHMTTTISQHIANEARSIAKSIVKQLVTTGYFFMAGCQ